MHGFGHANRDAYVHPYELTDHDCDQCAIRDADA